MNEGDVVYVPKAVSMYGRYVCLCMYKDEEFACMQSVPCKGMCAKKRVAVD